ncbi:MAG: hypothetical protein HY814_14905 [Candidatus Riflebacteria bacterium]|nr:hypothetical protein [Candidatus Riflebacteria bacterium]
MSWRAAYSDNPGRDGGWHGRLSPKTLAVVSFLLAGLLVGSTTAREHWARRRSVEAVAVPAPGLTELVRDEEDASAQVRRVGIVTAVAPDRSWLVLNSEGETFSLRCESQALPQPREPISQTVGAAPPSETGETSSTALMEGARVEITGRVVGRSRFGARYLDGTYKLLAAAPRASTQSGGADPPPMGPPTLDSLESAAPQMATSAPRLEHLLEGDEP